VSWCLRSVATELEFPPCCPELMFAMGMLLINLRDVSQQ
jgi:hypothetical protein